MRKKAEDGVVKLLWKVTKMKLIDFLIENSLPQFSSRSMGNSCKFLIAVNLAKAQKLIQAGGTLLDSIERRISFKHFVSKFFT